MVERRPSTIRVVVLLRRLTRRHRLRSTLRLQPSHRRVQDIRLPLRRSPRLPRVIVLNLHPSVLRHRVIHQRVRLSARRLHDTHLLLPPNCPLHLPGTRPPLLWLRRLRRGIRLLLPHTLLRHPLTLPRLLRTARRLHRGLLRVLLRTEVFTAVTHTSHLRLGINECSTLWILLFMYLHLQV